MASANMEELGKIADRVESLLCASRLPLPPGVHLQALQESLESLIQDLRRIYIDETGENPWE